MGTQGPRQQPACSRQLNAGGALTLTTWSSLRSTLAQESERSSNARNCGKTEGSGGPGWHRGHRQAPRKPHLLLRLLGGPRAGIPNGPVFRRGGQLLGLPERTRTGAPQVRAAWAARTADTRAPPVYSLLARDEVESLVRQGVELVRLLTGDPKEPCINCAASVKLIVVLPLSKETQIWSSSSRHSPSWAVTSTSQFLLR